MEQLLKDVDNPKELVQTLERTLENGSITGEEFALSQKVCAEKMAPFQEAHKRVKTSCKCLKLREFGECLIPGNYCRDVFSREVTKASL